MTQLQARRAPSLIRRHPAFAPTLVGLLGFAISVAGIWIPSLWYDEAATVTSATRSWAELWAEIQTVDAVHALYYAMIHLVIDVVGYSPLAIRLPSAFAVGLAAAVTVLTMRRLSTPRAAVIAGIVFCLLPRTTWMGTEGRSYAMTALAAVALTLVVVHAARTGRRRSWVLYGVLTVLSCALFVYLLLIVAAHGIWLLASTLRHRRTGAAVPWAIVTAITAVVVAPLVLAIAGQRGQVSWVGPLSSNTWQEVLRTQWFFSSLPAAVAGWLLIVAGTAVLLARRDRAGAVILPLVFAPTAVLLVATAVVAPLYTPRYLAMCLPFVAMVMAAAIDRLRPTVLGTITVASIAVLAVPTFVQQRQPEAKEDASWPQVAALIAAERVGDPGIVWGPVYRHPKATARVMQYSYPDAYVGTVDLTLDVSAAASGRLWETTHPLDSAVPQQRLDAVDQVFLIASTSRDARPATTAILADDGFEIVNQWSLTDVNIVEYARR